MASPQPPSTEPDRTSTLLLADLVGSTRAWETEPEAMIDVLGALDRIVEGCVLAHHGSRPLEQGEGDSFVLIFPLASDAVAAAVALQAAMIAEAWPGSLPVQLRVALHTGEVRERDDNRVMGEAVNRCARLRDLAHGAQVLMSGATHDLVVDRLDPRIGVVDLGSVRLRDLARPERVYQLTAEGLSSDFPRLRSLDHHPNNLPAQVTRFIGRERELAILGGLLTQNRLVSLVGPGGCGKTRLALQAAAGVLERFPDGIWLVDLSSVVEPEAVAAELARAIGVRDTREPPDQAALSALHGTTTLLVIDNCEHLVAAIASTAHDVLRGCPNVRVLATSREPLGVEGELVWRVPPMSLPEESAEGSEAVELFVDRARAARSGFRLSTENEVAVAAICRRVDGLPLAIELAAARVRVLSPTEIVTSLDDCFRLLGGGPRTSHDRQRTLHASIEWSHQLLDDLERVVFRRLGVFSGSFSVAAAVRVVSDGPVAAESVLDLLTSLADKSLLNVIETEDETRFELLEPIRQFASLALGAAGETQPTRDRHLAHYLACSREAAPHLIAGDGPWLRRIDADYENLRVAFDWSVSGSDARVPRWLTANLVFYWLTRGRWREGLHWVGTAVAEGGERAPESRGALLGGAFMALQIGDAALATRYVTHGVELARQADDEGALAWGLQVLAMVQDRTGADGYVLGALVEEVLALGEERIGPAAFAYGLGRRALNEWSRGELEAALATIGLASARPEVPPLTQAFYEETLVRIASDVGDLDTAEAAMSRATDALQRAGVATVVLHHERVRVLAMRGLLDDANDAAIEAVRHVEQATVSSLDAWMFHTVAMLFRSASDVPAAIAAITDPPPAMQPRVHEGVGWRSMFAAAAATAALVEGRRDQARDLFRRSLDEATDEGRGLYVPVANLGLAAVSRDAGQLAEAAHHGLLALDGFIAMGARPSITYAIDELAAVAIDGGAFVEGARLRGAARAERDRIGIADRPGLSDAFGPSFTRAVDALGPDPFESAFYEGGGMSVAEAAQLARKNRGRRNRPHAGWESLTPAELSVVRLVCDGLPNAQVADRLFVSTRTVTTHLGHVYAKLGLASRAELIAEAVRRSL